MFTVSTDETSLRKGDHPCHGDSGTSPDCSVSSTKAGIESPRSILGPPFYRASHTLAPPQDLCLHTPSVISASTAPISSTSPDYAPPQPLHRSAWAVVNFPYQSEPSNMETSVGALSTFPRGSPARQQCIDTYFARFHRSWPVVHRSTFNPKSDSQDLVDSIVMIGAWVSDSAWWMEIALRLHNSVVHRLAEKLDDMLFSTAYLHHSIMVAIFRGVGLFQEQYSLGPDDAKDAIPTSWLKQETLKRLAYLTFRVDVLFSFLRGLGPTLRYDTLCLTLPCSERLWEAQTAKEWHRVKHIESKKRSPIYFMNLVDQAMDQEGRSKLPRLLEDEYLSRMERGQTLLASGTTSCAGLSRSIDFWTMQLTIWMECYRNKALGSTLSSKSHRELCDISAVPLYHLSQIALRANLKAIKELSSEQRHHSHSVTFRRQLEASTLEWVKTSDARLAMWHAAKILNLVQEKASHETEASNADVACVAPCLELIASIALYEAGLVAWAYSRSVQVCDACVIGSSLQAVSVGPDPFELFGTEQDGLFEEWLENGGRESIGGSIVCACRLGGVVGLYEAALLRCGSRWNCVSKMANSLSRLKQGD
ncbi:hypothetical protein ACJZ2D_014683 [Fusarium nematophilum]